KIVTRTHAHHSHQLTSKPPPPNLSKQTPRRTSSYRPFMIRWCGGLREAANTGTGGVLDINERYVRLSEAGDPLEKLNAVVPWDVLRKPLANAEAFRRREGWSAALRPGDDVQDHGSAGALRPVG